MACPAPCSRLTIQERSSLEGIRSAWNQLLEKSYDNRLFVTFDWLKIWRTCSPGGAVRLIEALEDGDLVGVLPLLQTETAGGVELTLLGDPEVMDYMDALAERSRAQDLLRCLWLHALDELHWDRVRLRHVPSGSPLLTAFSLAGEELGHEVVVKEDSVCPVAILCTTWQGFLEMLTKKQRHEIRRKLRRAREGATLSLRTVRTSSELNRDLPVFFRLHEASGAGKAGFLTAEMRRFFAAVANTFLETDMLRLSILSRDDVDIAATLSFLYRGRWLLYNSGYDPAHAALSPGIAAVALAVEQAVGERALVFDFLSGDEPYKYQFGATNTYTTQATIEK